MPIIIPVASAADGETCAPTGQLGIAFDLAVHVARECGPVTDEYRIISNSLINNHALTCRPMMARISSVTSNRISL